MRCCVIGFLLVGVIVSSSLQANPACPESKAGMLNVHLVSHTHDDVGWLKTVDQYYYGARNDIQRAGVQYILDSVVSALQKDPARKFIYVESAFFYRWWDQQDQATKDTVKALVEAGQLEFIGGGWSMNDEAATHYNAIIDQMTLGLAKLNETFGEAARPTVAWQIDPFGHSREQASLFAQMGFDGLFFARLDYQDKSTRWDNKEMEMVWQASQNLGEAAWLFTGVLPNHYSPPAGFCFDILCSDAPIMDDPELNDYNVDERVNDFLKAAEDEREGYATSDIIMTMGMDFHYQYADSWFKNLDKLIRYVNQRQESGSNVNIFYSTPSCYVAALHAANYTWPTKSDDFFPYKSDDHAYWTGYFTSRPTHKRYIRETNGVLQATKQVSSLLGVGSTPGLELLKKAMGVMQHHDAVTGTEKQHVADDYAERLARGTAEAMGVMGQALSKLQPSEAERADNETSAAQFCPLLNISSCPITETAAAFTVSVYNPLARPVTHYVRVPVPPFVAYTVTDYQGNAVEAQLVPVPAPVLALPGRNSSAIYDLVFPATDIPPLGFLSFHVQVTGNYRALKKQLSSVRKHKLGGGGDIRLAGQDMTIILDADTGLLQYLTADVNGELQMVPVSQNFFIYLGMAGNNSEFEFRASGAYIFRPNGTDPQAVAAQAQITTVEGPLVTEVHQEWGPWVSQVLRTYKGVKEVEMEWLVGPIPVDDDVGREIVTRVDWGDIASGDTFYTDANGREMLKRVIDFRPTWQLDNKEPVAGNYYPVNSRLILDNGAGGKAAVLTDRSQGGTSLRSGQAELMVHRRLLHDDAFGVAEALNEKQFGVGLVARGKHYLLHSSFSSEECDFGCMHRTLGEELLLPPVYLFEETSASAATWQKSSVNKFRGLNASLPASVHLLTLEPWGENKLLLRLEHMYEAGESANHSDPVTVSLQGLLADWTIVAAEETILSANLFKKDEGRLQWQVEEKESSPSSTAQSRRKTHRTTRDDLSVTLQPMEIRTFILTVQQATHRF